MTDRILNKQEILKQFHDFADIYTKVAKDVEEMSEGKAKDLNDLLHHFIDQCEGYMDWINTTTLVESMKEGA